MTKDRSAAVRLLLAATILASPMLVARPASAQFGTRQEVVNVFLPAPRELRRMLSAAEEAIAERRYAEAVDALGSILVDTESEDYFLGTGEGAQASLKAEAQRLLGAMPNEGRQQYEIKYGPEAERLLEQAVVGGNMQALTDITRMYFHTRAGYNATLLLGRYEMNQGRPLAAALHFQRLARSSAGRQFEPQLSLLLANCWLMSGQPASAEQALAEMKQRVSGGKVRIAGRDVPLFESDSEALAWLEENCGATISDQRGSGSDWLVHRGNPARNAVTVGAMPRMTELWRLPTTNDPSDEEIVETAMQGFLDRNEPALPAFQPLAVGDWVLMRTPECLIGVNMHTGKRVWEYPWFKTSFEDHGSTPTGSRGASGPRQEELTQRLWEDAPYGQIACDGESVFILDKLAPAYNRSNQRVVIMPGGGRMLQGAQTSNELVALTLKRQGTLKWIVGGDSGGDEPKLADVFFLGPPLPLGGVLYVLGEANSEIRLFAIDSETGRLEWAQQLALLENQSVLTNRTRRLAGATPSFSDGVLVCPTSAGALVALDLSTRSLLWGYQYKRPTVVSRFRSVPTQQRDIGSHWADATVTIAGGRVLVTPVEADSLLCLDLFTGESAWETDMTRDDGLYVASADHELAVIVGAKSLRGIRMSDAKILWETPLDGMPSGRGFASGGSYFLPTTSSEILKFDFADGKISERVETVIRDTDGVKTPIVLGNLICHQEYILAHGPLSLWKFFQDKDLLEKVAAALERNPDDIMKLKLYGELLLSDGEIDESLAVLRKAYELSDESDEHRDALADALLTALETDFAGYRHLADEAQAVVDHPRGLPERRSRYLRAMAVGWQSAGELQKSLDCYLQLIAAQPEPSFRETSRVALEQAGPNWRVRRGRWVHVRLEELYAAADEDQRDAMQATVAGQLESAVAAAEEGKLGPLSRLVDFFDAQPQADAARLKLAAGLIVSGRWLEADLLLASLREQDDVQIAAAAAAHECRLLAQAGLTEAAARRYLALAERYGDTVCLDGQTGRELVDEIAPQSPIGQALARIQPWKSGAAVVDVSSDASTTRNAAGDIYQPTFPADVFALDGSADRLSVKIDPQLQQLILSDDLGREVSRLVFRQASPTNAGVPPIYNLVHGRTVGRLLVLSMGNEMLGIDLLEALRGSGDAILWRRNLVTSNGIYKLKFTSLETPFGQSRYFPVYPVNGVEKPVGQIAGVGRGGVCFQAEGQLLCLDPLTGEEIWKRSGFEGAEVFGDDELLFVIPDVGYFEKDAPENYHDGHTVLVFSAVDGRELGRRSFDPPRWDTFGRNVLTYRTREEDGTVELKLTDLWSGEVLLEKKCSAAARASIVDRRELAMLEPDGKFTLHRLDDGVQRFAAQLEPEARLASVHVLRYDDQYLVMVSSDIINPLPDTVVQAAPGGFHAPLVHGRLYALDPQTGRMQWPSPAVIDQHGLPLDQPRGSPVLVLLRQLISTKSRARQTSTSVLCLDRRDGRVIAAHDDIHANLASPYGMTADREQQTLKVSVPTKMFTIRFTDEPTPPAPPAQMGDPQLGQARLDGGSFDPFSARRNTTLRPEVPVPPIAPPRDPFADPFAP